MIQARLAELADAFALVNHVLHKFDGSQDDATFGMPDMRTAHQYLNSAWLWAKEAVEKN